MLNLDPSDLGTTTPPPPAPRSPWRRRLVVLGILVLVAAAAGVAAALTLFRLDEVVDVDQLADYDPSTITRVRDRDGVVIAEFARERRILLTYEELPADLKNAIVAVEDSGFFEHSGLNLRGILRAFLANARAGVIVEGGSSLTQQLAKVMFLTPERSLRRKLREAVLALHLEATYSKEEILTFYCNQVYLGHSRYGVAAASRFYFGKEARDLELHEAALIAGLPKKPAGYSPFRHPETARARRNHVLARMAAVGYITAEQEAAAAARDLGLRPDSLVPKSTAPYFVEEVRKMLEERYGVRGLYHQGLQVHSTLDRRLQSAAEEAVRNGLLAIDHRHGWRTPKRNLLGTDPERDLDAWASPAWKRPLVAGALVPGLVMDVRGDSITVRVGRHRAVVTDAPKWTRRKRASDLHRRGDVGMFRVIAVDPEIELGIEQEPEVEGALVALDVHTGEVLAMVGGWDFARSRFNRAVQARRQTGSAFKPYVYATALAEGVTPADVLFDEPIELVDETTGAVYTPENHGGRYYGLTTVREALEKSRNPLSVMLLQRAGPERVIDTARRLGITARLEPYPSLALGAFEISLLEMTSAYSAFADQGVAHTPYLVRRIEDRDGQVLLERRPTSRRALDPPIAYITTQLLVGVIHNGTGRRARSLHRTLAGKTGTTDGFTDAWFVGFSPDIAVGVWVGHDQKRSIGKGEEGSRAALPIWIDFMEAALADRPDRAFTQPPGVELVAIDKTTGLRATESCQHVFQEVFVRGTAPARYCSEREHALRAMPYYLQRLWLADNGIDVASLQSAEAAPPADQSLDLFRDPIVR